MLTIGTIFVHCDFISGISGITQSYVVGKLINIAVYVYSVFPIMLLALLSLLIYLILTIQISRNHLHKAYVSQVSNYLKS